MFHTVHSASGSMEGFIISNLYIYIFLKFEFISSCSVMVKNYPSEQKVLCSILGKEFVVVGLFVLLCHMFSLPVGLSFTRFCNSRISS